MFLAELYKYRTRRTEHQEDYLSTCMAELMRRDQVACRAILEALQLSPPGNLADRVVHTQFRYPGSKDRPDIVIQIGRGPDVWRAAIECKLKAWPNRSQVARYEALEPHVSLLAPADKLALDDTWRGVPRGSWESIWGRLKRENAKLDPADVPRFRADFMDLLKSFGLAGLPSPSPQEVREAIRAHRRFAGWHDLLQAAVTQLIEVHGLSIQPSEGQGGGKRQAVWGSSSGLDVYWEADKPPVKGLPLEGLGLSAEVGQGAGAPVLEWKLWVYPSKSARKAHRALVSPDGAWDDGRWWALHLADSGDPEAPFQDHVRRVVAGARLWLEEDLGLAVPQREPELPAHLGTHPLPAVMYALRRYDDIDRALARWAAELRRQVFAALKNRLGEARVRLTTRGRKKIILSGAGGRDLHMSTWHELNDDGAKIGFWVWFGGKRRNQAMTRLLLERRWPDGIHAEANARWLNWNVVLDPSVTDLAATIPLIAEGLAEALAEMDETLFPNTQQ